MEAEAECESTAPPPQEPPPNGSIPQPPPASLMCSSAFYPDDADSACSSPYFSAPSSPGRSGALPLPNYCYYFSAPTSPVHYVLASLPYTADDTTEDGGGPSTAGGEVSSPSGSSEFEFSARFSDSFGGGGGAGARDAVEMMCPADELFLNGQIRPMRLACHLERPQALAPLPDLEGEGEGGVDEEEEDEGHEKEARRPSVLEDEFPGAVARGREHFFSKSKLRNRSLHRRARSMSPLRSSREPPFLWRDEGREDEREKPAARSASRRSSGVGVEEGNAGAEVAHLGEEDVHRCGEVEEESEEAPTPSVSASSSRCSSSSSGRNSKRWIFLKDLLYRSKSEGRGNEREREIRERERFWHNISFSPAKDKAASLFAFSRVAKLKEKQSASTEAAVDGATAGTGAGAEAQAQSEEGVSADPEQACAVPPSAEPKMGEVEDDKKKKQKPKPKPKQKKKKNDEEPGPAPTADIAGGSRPAKPAAGVAGKRRMTSAHERHYAAKRAQAEELRKRTFLPYRQGLLGCLGFSSRGYTYTAVTGLARTLNTVSSR